MNVSNNWLKKLNTLLFSKELNHKNQWSEWQQQGHKLVCHFEFETASGEAFTVTHETPLDELNNHIRNLENSTV